MKNNPTIYGVSRELLQHAFNAVNYLSLRADDIGSSNVPIAEALRALLDAPVEPFNLDGWGIDHSAGRPVLVHNRCSVIEAEQAYGLLELINAASDAPAVEPTNVLREHCKQCAEVVKNWPEWKQNCLGGVPPVERKEPEFPAGAIHNGRAFIDQLENIYAFKEQQGHALSLCSEWQELVRCFEWLANHATDSQSTIAQLQARVQELESGRGEPVAYIVEAVDPSNGNLRRRGLHWHSFETLRNTRDFKWWIGENTAREQPLFTAPPAPVAVVLPERADAYTGSHDAQRGWNDCLEACKQAIIAALNGEQK